MKTAAHRANARLTQGDFSFDITRTPQENTCRWSTGSADAGVSGSFVRDEDQGVKWSADGSADASSIPRRARGRALQAC